MSRREKRKAEQATLRTDLSRVLLCGLGAIGVCLVITAFLDEESDSSAAGLIIVGVIGLILIAIGLFAKPRAVEKAADGVNLHNYST